MASTLSDHVQNRLTKLYVSDKDKWRASITKTIRTHPSQHKILEIGKTTDLSHVTMSQFQKALPNIKKDLVAQIYQDIDEMDDSTGTISLCIIFVYSAFEDSEPVSPRNLSIEFKTLSVSLSGDGKLKITSIVRWVNNKKRQKEVEVVKDENWLYEKLKHQIRFDHMDVDDDGVLSLEEMHRALDKEGVDPRITDLIFRKCDKNGDGSINSQEWWRFQDRYLKKKHIKKWFARVVCK